MLLLKVYETYLSFLNISRLVRRRRTRIWTRFIYTENERELHGFFNKLFLIIKTKDSNEFRKATRMGIEQFMLLNTLVENKIKKKDFIRQSISPECRLAITLVYLGHGVCHQMLAWPFRIGVSTVRGIILETCKAIWSELQEIYLSPPNESEWKKIADEFYENTGMPHVIGAIDGKHIEIKCPSNSGTLYFNYKQYFSIVLLAACDSRYTFTAVDIGAYGSQSDGGILKTSGFGNQILRETINVPKPEPLPNSTVEFPFYFVADSAFPLKRNIMRPYPGRTLPLNKQNFNRKLSNARVRIENTFGILTAKWRVLTNCLNMMPENAEKIVQACVVLHNFVKMHDSANYCPNNYVDHVSNTGQAILGNWREEVPPLRSSKIFHCSNASQNAFGMRDFRESYLNN